MRNIDSIVVNKCDIFSLKCTRIRLAAGLHLDPLGELKCFPIPPSRYKEEGPPGRERGRGRSGKRKRGTGRRGEKKWERRREGMGEERRGGEDWGGVISHICWGFRRHCVNRLCSDLNKQQITTQWQFVVVKILRKIAIQAIQKSFKVIYFGVSGKATMEWNNTT